MRIFNKYVQVYFRSEIFIEEIEWAEFQENSKFSFSFWENMTEIITCGWILGFQRVHLAYDFCDFPEKSQRWQFRLEIWIQPINDN